MEIVYATPNITMTGQVFNAYHVNTAVNHAQMVLSAHHAIIRNSDYLTAALNTVLAEGDSTIMDYRNSFAWPAIRHA
jgi:hexokinase